MTWWLVPITGLGILWILAPVIGARWACWEVWSHCPRCGRELIGTPPEHREADRLFCRLMAAKEGYRW